MSFVFFARTTSQESSTRVKRGEFLRKIKRKNRVNKLKKEEEEEEKRDRQTQNF